VAFFESDDITSKHDKIPVIPTRNAIYCNPHAFCLQLW